MKTIPKEALGAIPSITIEPAGSKGTKHTCTLLGHLLDTRTSLNRMYDACVVIAESNTACIDFYRKGLENTKKGQWWIDNCTAKLAEYEKLEAEGLVNITVGTWCGNRVLAGKQLSRWSGPRYIVQIAERI
jgi:hypothetical protein